MNPKIATKLHDAFKKSLDDPAVMAAINRYDMTINYLNGEDYAKFVKQVTAEEKATLEAIGLGKTK
jgi:tripartite-type tricarboxylate transporter receptor subunit TctC